MRVCLLTVCNKEYAPIGDITLPNMQAYCVKHGYEFRLGLYHTDPEKLETYGDRGKLTLYTTHYNDFDVIMFLDVDALIMNSEIRIEDVLGDRPFLWTYDADGPCSGFWIARTVPSVFRTISYVKNRAPLMGNVRPRWEPGPPAKTVLDLEPTGQSDQEVMRSIMHIPPHSQVLGNIVSGKEAGHCYDYRILGWPEAFDDVNHYAPGDWIVTYPSVPLEKRIECLKFAAQEAR